MQFTSANAMQMTLQPTFNKLFIESYLFRIDNFRTYFTDLSNLKHKYLQIYLNFQTSRFARVFCRIIPSLFIFSKTKPGILPTSKLPSLPSYPSASAPLSVAH